MSTRCLFRPVPACGFASLSLTPIVFDKDLYTLAMIAFCVQGEAVSEQVLVRPWSFGLDVWKNFPKSWHQSHVKI